MIDAYAIYSQWCRDHGQEPPSREWWDAACNQNYEPLNVAMQDILADQREIDRERREGWAYGE